MFYQLSIETSLSRYYLLTMATLVKLLLALHGNTASKSHSAWLWTWTAGQVSSAYVITTAEKWKGGQGKMKSCVGERESVLHWFQRADLKHIVCVIVVWSPPSYTHVNLALTSNSSFICSSSTVAPAHEIVKIGVSPKAMSSLSMIRCLVALCLPFVW